MTGCPLVESIVHNHAIGMLNVGIGFDDTIRQTVIHGGEGCAQGWSERRGGVARGDALVHSESFTTASAEESRPQFQPLPPPSAPMRSCPLPVHHRSTSSHASSSN